MAVFMAAGAQVRAEAGVLVAAEYDALGGASYGVGGVFFAGQTFLAVRSGAVHDVTLLLKAGNLDPPDFLTVAVTDVTGGRPDTVLASITIDAPVLASSSGAPQPYAVDFSETGFGLTAGTPYGIRLNASPGISISGDSVLSNNVSETYADGAAFTSSTSGTTWSAFAFDSRSDFEFRITVVPEPASLLLFGVGTLVLHARRRRV